MPVGKGPILMMGIDEITYQTIKEERLHHPLDVWRIPVHGLRQQQKKHREEPIPSTSEEVKSKSDVGSTGSVFRFKEGDKSLTHTFATN